MTGKTNSGGGNQAFKYFEGSGYDLSAYSSSELGKSLNIHTGLRRIVGYEINFNGSYRLKASPGGSYSSSQRGFIIGIPPIGGLSFDLSDGQNIAVVVATVLGGVITLTLPEHNDLGSIRATEISINAIGV